MCTRPKVLKKIWSAPNAHRSVTHTTHCKQIMKVAGKRPTAKSTTGEDADNGERYKYIKVLFHAHGRDLTQKPELPVVGARWP